MGSPPPARSGPDPGRTFVAPSLPAAQAGDILKWIDPFIGTAGDHGQLYPGATFPFGLVKLSPDTPGEGHAGYDYLERRILGFSHTRLGGVGCRGAGGTLLVTPEPPGPIWTSLHKTSDERAEPGYYRVRFTSDLVAEMTVGPRVGYHRYTYPGDEEMAEIRFDAGHALGGEGQARVRIIDDRTVTGQVTAPNVCDESRDMLHRLHFAARLEGQVSDLRLTGEGEGRFRVILAGDSAVDLRVALSPVSEAVALAELDADPAAGDFDAARAEARRAWRKVLGRIRVMDDDPGKVPLKRLFYTGLYRSLLLPHNATSSDGRYRVASDYPRIRKAEAGHVHYSGWSTWDDYRKSALIGLLAPEVLADMAGSILTLYQAGPVPEWAEGLWPTPSVRNEMMQAIVLEALAKGLVDPDRVRGAYKDLTAYHHGNVLEQAYSQWVAMRLAERLGLDDEAARHRPGALGYRRHWVADQRDVEGRPRGFMTPKGRPVRYRKADRIDAHFYEGNLWHYRWWVPHDVGALVELDGGPARFAENLAYYFESDRHMALNEPPLAYPFLFVWAGRPWLTQKWSRHFTTDTVVQIYHNHGLLKEPHRRPVFLDEPAGWLPGMDDDTGTMSSQFVYQALGLFPACTGEPYYVIGSPVFEKVEITVGGGRVFSLEAPGSSVKNRYVQSAMLNGKPLDRAWIRHSELWAGGILVLEMGPEPNRVWGSDPATAPPSMSEGKAGEGAG